MRVRHWPVDSIHVYHDPVDMRKSIDGLAAIVELELERSPFAPALFVFCNRQRDKVKLLYWERNGFVLWYKRLEKQRFKWPKRLRDVFPE
jgi:transposase